MKCNGVLQADRGVAVEPADQRILGYRLHRRGTRDRHVLCLGDLTAELSLKELDQLQRAPSPTRALVEIGKRAVADVPEIGPARKASRSRLGCVPVTYLRFHYGN